MSSDPKQTAPPGLTGAPHRGVGIRVFTYPKLIFIFPTLIASVICAVGMKLIRDRTDDPLVSGATIAAPTVVAPPTEVQTTTKGKAGETVTVKETVRAAKGTETKVAEPAGTPVRVMAKHERFTTPQNLLGVLFLGVFAFNLLIMAIDFPRFTVVAVILLAGFIGFFLAWLGAYLDYELMRGVRWIMGQIYVVANAEFYFMIALVLLGIFGIIWVTRWLDYWEIMPNEILHHHGPLSDLERLPTLNLKFDKEIPDVVEFLFLGAGRLVLHVTEERKAIVLDNVLFINSKEEALKKLMSRLEVRVTTDQEVAEP